MTGMQREKELKGMGRTMKKCGIFLLLLILAAGIFWIFQKQETENLKENGTLVKNICTAGREGQSV